MFFWEEYQNWSIGNFLKNFLLYDDNVNQLG